MPRILSHGRACFDEAGLSCAESDAVVPVANNAAAEPFSKERREKDDADEAFSCCVWGMLLLLSCSTHAHGQQAGLVELGHR